MTARPHLPWSKHPRVQGYLRKLLMPLGIDFYLEMDDRRVLEQIVLPWFAAQDDVARVLFIGCDWYTRGYRKYFGGDAYWTLDVDAAKRRHGARRHIVASAAEIGSHFGPGSLDLIICNGVYGWGLDSRDEFEAMVRGCRHALRDDGHFLLGWDDNEQHRPFPLAESQELARMRRSAFPPLGTDHYLTANAGRHTFDFFRK